VEKYIKCLKISIKQSNDRFEAAKEKNNYARMTIETAYGDALRDALELADICAKS
jgi:hypothetical protein